MTTESAQAEVQPDEIRSTEWSDDSGSERDLVQAILARRLDETLVVSSSLERIRRCHSLGFPAELAAPVLLLRATASAPGCDKDTAALTAPFRTENGDVRLPPEQFELLGRLLQAGYRLEATQWAVRLLPSLSKSALPTLEREFSVSTEDVRVYGEQSGDLNPLHFDDDFARSHGFERRISHGMLFNGWLTRLLGTEHPGPGTIFLRNSASFFAPVYADHPYRVRISTPRRDPAKGTHLVLAQLFDASGRHCAVSYNDVLLRPPRP